jgi:hypothetical protein
MHELGAMGDAEYYPFVTRRLHPEYDHLWEHYLLSRELVERTRGVLVEAKQLVGTGSTADKARLAELRAARDAGRITDREYGAAKAPLDEKRRRRMKFLHLVEMRLRQLKAAHHAHRQTAHDLHQARNRDRSRAVATRLALAVHAHRAAVLGGGGTPAPHDLVLWGRLADERLDFGGRAMSLDDAITEGFWFAREGDT